MPETPSPQRLELGRLKSLDGSPQIDVRLQFNPASLQYSIQNTLKEEGQGAKKKQHVSQTSAKLTMDLVFDTTDTGIDVRETTEKVGKLLQPVGKSKAPQTVEFSWGSYSFKGLIEQFKETLDFFSPEGVPLRSSINLTLSSQELTFSSKFNPRATVDDDLKPEPVTVPQRAGGAAPSPASLANQLGAPRSARAIAAANGVASLRFGAGASIGASAGAGASLSIDAGVVLAPASAFSVGASAGAGIGIGVSGGVGIGAGAGISFGAGAGVAATASTGAFGNLRAGASGFDAALPDPRALIAGTASVSLTAGTQFGPGGRALSAPANASLSVDVGADADLSTRIAFSS
jgi:hypothetical protein